MANSWNSVAYGDGVWVAVAFTGDNRVMRSTDVGQTWSAVAETETSDFRSVAYGDGVWVSVASAGANRVIRSGQRIVRGSTSVEPPSAQGIFAQGIFLTIVGSEGRTVAGTEVIHGSTGIAPNSPYTLTIQGMTAPASSGTLLAFGVKNGGGHVEGRIRLGALTPGSYKIVMIGTDRLGHALVLTNHVVIDGAGKFFSVSPESLQPTLR